MIDLRNLPPLPVNIPEQREEIKQLLAMFAMRVITALSMNAMFRVTGLELLCPCQSMGGSHEFSFGLWLPKKGHHKYPIIVYLTGADVMAAYIPFAMLAANDHYAAIMIGSEAWIE